MSTKLSILLDTRRIKKYTIKLRVTFERFTEYYQSIFDLSKEEFEKLTASRISSELQSIGDKLKEIERTAENAVNELEHFSFADFEKDFIQKNNLFRQRKLSLKSHHKIQMSSTTLLFTNSFRYHLKRLRSPVPFQSLIWHLVKKF